MPTIRGRDGHGRGVATLCRSRNTKIASRSARVIGVAFQIVEQEPEPNDERGSGHSNGRISMRQGLTRPNALKTAALATTALIAAPYVRGAHAAGRLSIGFWDHWVPGGNNASKALVEE